MKSWVFISMSFNYINLCIFLVYLINSKINFAVPNIVLLLTCEKVITNVFSIIHNIQK
jgi:hypothetical protein